ncbi:hypothetical protein BDA96_08G158200 [Sorghum bicolor]|uniref:Secreted protein n=2 Tax=Sorghum bicolor TaxID=4558 RepID=A0A921QFX7_SORBI|nr:hypothetical protein BDA96_08G158200 [Sorghum bicolor]OQU79432.1 hypothetical protein SORBI_3008G142832 [Sorghum bicolor]
MAPVLFSPVAVLVVSLLEVELQEKRQQRLVGWMDGCRFAEIPLTGSMKHPCLPNCFETDIAVAMHAQLRLRPQIANLELFLVIVVDSS